MDYPDRTLNRLTTFFRLFTVIPIAIVLGTVSHATFGGWDSNGTTYIAAGGILFAGPLSDDPVPQEVPALVVRLEPRADALHPAGVRLRRSDERRVPVDRRASSTSTSRSTTRTPRPTWPAGMPLVKWFLAIPHYFVLFFLYIAAFFA